MSEETELPRAWQDQIAKVEALTPIKEVKLDFASRHTGDEFHLHVIAPLDHYNTELIAALEAAKAWVSRVRAKLLAVREAERKGLRDE